ncbi:MAG: hypothetical protein JXA18_08365 [Chitinispirillaceae bacterium]|nr:hypothetical protein [Chitinispirillaceae bacterium]
MYKKIIMSILASTCALMAFFSCSQDQDPQSSGYDMVPVEKSCLFVSAVGDTGDPRDVPLINKLRSWGCEVRVVASTELTAMVDSFTLYDFAFLSESPNSSHYAPFRGHPVPILNLESWGAAKMTEALYWSRYPASVKNYDTLTLVIAADAPAELTGGLAAGTEFKFATATSGENAVEMGFIPTIQNIPIARFKCDTLVAARVALNEFDSSALTFSGGLLTAACAVEKGTLLADSLTTTLCRAVTIGIHANAYEYITDEAYAMIHAGIVWILE